MDYFLTPADLSRELGVDQRKVRAYLREQYGRLTRSETRWRLNDQRAAKVRARFRAEL
jgi:ribosomal protein L32E